MKETNDYRVIAVTMGFSMKKAVSQLAVEVNEAIARGWKTADGVAVGGTQLMQAMVRSR
ncbi:hypothetical protein N9023_02645 [Opitutaceae bacterium]|nr:hypothetical protein [Opitutaceae bacterium]MDB4473881.1 hypothetical protein [Opitutaceae bacterium]